MRGMGPAHFSFNSPKGRCAACDGLGATLVDVDVPHAQYATNAGWIVAMAEAAAFHEQRLRQTPELFDPVVRERLDAARFYAECALEAGVGFVNAIPVFIASDPVWARRFWEAGLPIIGDDIKSQVGATIVHRQLATLFEPYGKLTKSNPLDNKNFGFVELLTTEDRAIEVIIKLSRITFCNNLLRVRNLGLVILFLFFLIDFTLFEAFKTIILCFKTFFLPLW